MVDAAGQRDHWIVGLEAVLVALKEGRRFDPAPLREVLSCEAVSRPHRVLMGALVDAAAKVGGRAREALLAELRQGLDTNLASHRPRWAHEIPEYMTKLGVPSSELVEQALRIVRGKKGWEREGRMRVLHGLTEAVRQDREAATRIYRAALERAGEEPYLVGEPRSGWAADVADAFFRGITPHIGQLRDRWNFWSLGSALRTVLTADDTKRVASALAEVATTWNDYVLACFLEATTKLVRVDRSTAKRIDDVLRAVLPGALERSPGWAAYPVPKRMLAKLKIGPKTKVLRLPPTLPVDVTEALALLTRYVVDRETIELRPAPKPSAVATAAKLVAMPKDLLALYAACDGVGRHVAPVASLRALQRGFASEVRRLVKDHEDEVRERGALDVRSLSPIEELVAIGTDGGGDTFFVDARRKTSEDTVPVLRFVHDEACVVRPEAPSIGAFVAARVLEAWTENEGEGDAWRRKLAAEQKRAMPVMRAGKKAAAKQRSRRRKGSVER